MFKNSGVKRKMLFGFGIVLLILASLGGFNAYKMDDLKGDVLVAKNEIINFQKKDIKN